MFSTAPTISIKLSRQRLAMLDAERQFDLLGTPFEKRREQVLICRRFVRRFFKKRSSTATKSESSYSLKHCVEKWFLMENGSPGYVSNAALIQAAVLEDFDAWQISTQSTCLCPSGPENFYFNLWGAEVAKMRATVDAIQVKV